MIFTYMAYCLSGVWIISISSENLELQGFLGIFSFQWLQIGYTCHLATIRDSSSIDNTFELGSYFALYSNSNDVYVIRDQSGKRIAGSTMGAGISSGITWFFRADLYCSCNGIFCIYNSARKLFLLWQSFNLHSQKAAGKSFYERLQTGIGTCNLSGRRNGDVSFMGSFRCTDGGYGAH